MLSCLVCFRTVQLLWHQLRVSVLVLKERLLQGLQDSNGNFTRQTDILQAFTEDQHQVRHALTNTLMHKTHNKSDFLTGVVLLPQFYFDFKRSSEVKLIISSSPDSPGRSDGGGRLRSADHPLQPGLLLFRLWHHRL